MYIKVKYLVIANYPKNRVILVNPLERLEVICILQSNLSMTTSWTWNQFSESKLLSVEKTILSVLKSKYITRFVNIKWETGTNERIWTISLNTESKNTPLVLLHGFAAGIGFWVRNLDPLSKDRPVYAIDLLGFGRSSRPEFSMDSLEAERQMVDSIEAWRRQMELEQFILLGHSMGGFLATSYAISYPERVKHLILADPWGFQDKSQASPKNPKLLFKILGIVLYPFTNLNPLASVRALGPFGPWVIQRMRGDIIDKFDDIFEDKTIIPNYIYHCNAQNPTGEAAFHRMIHGFGWARNPMIHRIPNLKKEIPITYMNGSDSWMDQDGTMAPRIREMRSDCFVDIKIIENAGHHIYADQADQFNDIIIKACKIADDEDDKVPILTLKNGHYKLKENEEDDSIDYSDDNNSEFETNLS
ncbi:(Lyso)-N-acylphosphatidylethanolamine lipase-like [Coccinella septempunctata]|uniref:(Lyso)-N-acylphosphatidylethanolamine lipase-like n=1 Tax=Coccinella septempunctata TaxID=41139 RepID=UPI001D068ADC|nr:(Lyso)-N-acylphosphatidylethanolamine lipase-like [Coccinella septempunctata]XP_044747234.1 (Lyso)-N-acylphosphatidylethanolamine lipase-like [Coccinella septempunctata]